MQLDPQAQEIVQRMEESGGKPIEELSPEETRRQPTPADAVVSVLERRGEDATPEAVGRVEDRVIAGAARDDPGPHLLTRRRPTRSHPRSPKASAAQSAFQKIVVSHGRPSG